MLQTTQKKFDFLTTSLNYYIFVKTSTLLNTKMSMKDFHVSPVVQKLS